jgi:hypothetical protein
MQQAKACGCEQRGLDEQTLRVASDEPPSEERRGAQAQQV